MTRFTTNILICSTKTPQLSYMLHSSPPEVKLLFYPGLWHLSWRPWWWETTVNRLSFFLKLLLYKIIIDLEKNPCWGSFVLRDYRKEKEKKTEYNSSFLRNPGLHWNAISQAPQQATTIYFAATMAVCFYTHLADRCETIKWQERWQKGDT